MVFPVSNEIIVEILSQKDRKTLLATADLVDELSSGLCIISGEERQEFDFLNEIRMIEHSERLEAKCHCWTTISFCRGLKIPMGIEGNLQAEKVHVDRMWNKSLRDFVETKGYAESREFEKFPDLSAELNMEKMSLIDSSDSRHEIYKSELANILVECVDIPMALAKKGLIDLPDDASADEFCVVGKNTCNSIFDKLEDNTDREFLPSYHIPAAIAASVWRDKKRKIKPTDWLDFQHAGTAIPYLSLIHI